MRCPRVERSPNLCTCRCYGCRFHCDFHWGPRLRFSQWLRDLR